MLKQHPSGRVPHGKVAIVTPASVVSQWVKEFVKWLGRERVRVVCVDDLSRNPAIERLEAFQRTVAEQVLVISYEQFRNLGKAMNQVTFNLLICDEVATVLYR